MAEKDFLSLKLTHNSMDEDVKEIGGAEDTVYMKGSGMQWPFSNKVSALPQFMPYKSLQEERSKRISFDQVVSSASMPVSTGDAFDSSHKTYYGQPKNFGVDRQGGPPYTVTTYPVQHVDSTTTYPVHPGHRAPDMGTFYVNNPYFKTHVSTSRHNFTPTMRQQSLGGTLVPNQQSYVHNVSSMANIADQRIASKPTGAPTQLTIFYGGSVCVYDDISPEKAQNIMRMAGSGSSKNANITSLRNQVQVSNSRPLGGDACHGKQSLTTSHCSGLSSPISVTSHANVQSGSGSNGTDDSMAVKPVVEMTAPSSQLEMRKSPTPTGSVPAPMVAAAVPQARRVSLARFLEKRKERVTNTMPYQSSSINLTEKIGSGSPPTSKELSWNMRFTTNNNNSENVHTKLEM